MKEHEHLVASLRRRILGLSPAGRVPTSVMFDPEYALSQARERLAYAGDAASFPRAFVRDPDLFMIDPGPLFDSAYYIDRYPDVASYRFHPFDHFIRHGFYDTRSPHPLIDLAYVRKRAEDAGVVLTTPDDLPAALGQVDPHPLFSNERARQRGGADVARFSCPLEYHVRSERQRPDIPSNPAEAGTGSTTATQPHRLRLEAGEDGERTDLDLLLGVLSAHGIKAPPLPPQLPWPRTTAGYTSMAEVRNPLLHGPLPDRISLGIGVVLYETDREELERLVRALESELSELTEQRPLTTRILFAVNDGRVATYREWLDGLPRTAVSVEVRESGSNVGFGRAHNDLMSAAFADGAEHYLGLNPDGFPMRGCLDNLLRLSTVVGDLSLIEADAFPVGHPKWFDPVSFETEWVSGVAFLLPMGLYELVGGFDDHFHMYCEDVDLSWRVRVAGGGTLVCPTALYYHDVVPRFTSEDDQARVAMLRSARLLGHKWSHPEFVEQMERILLEERLLERSQLPPLPEIEPIASSIPNFDFGLRFARSRYW